MEAKEVLDALKQIEQARDELRSLATTKPEGWKKSYALARHGLHDAVDKLGALGRRWFETSDRGNAAAFEQVMEAARAKINQHQARYPVLTIDKQGPDYQASMLEVDQKFRAVISFLHTHVGG